MASLILIFVAGLGILFVILSMMMLHELYKRGVKINVLFIRLLTLKYIHQYKQITLEETGKVGPLFYPCIISINIALVLTVVAFILYI
jgi:hypothetical protein